jgi:hypothetical protein
MNPPRNLQYYERSRLGPVLVGTARSYEEGTQAVRNTDMALYYEQGWLHEGTWYAECPILKPAKQDRDWTTHQKYISFLDDTPRSKPWCLRIDRLGVCKYYGELDMAVAARDRILQKQKGRKAS